MIIFWTAVMYFVLIVVSYAFFHKDTPGVAMIVLAIVWCGVAFVYLQLFVFAPLLPAFEFLLRAVGSILFILVATLQGKRDAPGESEEDEEVEGKG